MYFPYLRGKQFELVLLREMAGFIADNGRIVPVIEPVRKNLSGLAGTIKILCKNKVKFVLITNPIVGDWKAHPVNMEDELISRVLSGCNSHYLGFVVSDGTTAPEIVGFFKKYRSRKVCLVHNTSFKDRDLLVDEVMRHPEDAYNLFVENKTSRGYRNVFKAYSRIIIRDGFEARDNNKDYPEEEYFSDIHMTYDELKFNGFGDYLTVGDQYREAGGPAYTIAIHITYINDDGEDDDMWIKHFKSETTKTPVDPGGKFAEALEKFHDYYIGEEHLIYETEAVKEFMKLHKTGHYPGLGYSKKLSMKHHIELIAKKVFDT